MIFPNIIICQILVFVDDKTLIMLKSISEFEIFFFGEYKNRFYRERIEYMYPELIYLKENYEWEKLYLSIYLANNIANIQYKELHCVDHRQYLTLKVLDHLNLLDLKNSIIVDKIIGFIIDNDDSDYLIKFTNKYKMRLHEGYATIASYKNKQKILEYLLTINLKPNENVVKRMIAYDQNLRNNFLKKKLFHTKREDECD